jgi:hypothetical protein
MTVNYNIFFLSAEFNDIAVVCRQSSTGITTKFCQFAICCTRLKNISFIIMIERAAGNKRSFYASLKFC